MAPARGADFEVSVSGWLGHPNTGTNPTLPELQRMPPAKVLCVYGAREQPDSLCTAPGLARMTRLQRPGDHHFDRRYDIIVDAIRGRLASFNNDRHS
ncbi:MAG: AcvB/VirJ family lysyl-phosphatidylglycerol hydrolase [Immundisolibacter sp.]|uniref:AcvB/VirJ family lysyl-phosphatidylglycerol hydrolase n=1 Tax=Immundisolibacter sp. TaxID=1934948 RepID=UPI003EDF4874